MKLLLASSNKHKAQEFKALLPLDIEILLPEELGISFQCEEDKETFMENSILKAKALYNAELEALGEEKAIPVIADDSGLIVDALPGQLGVRTARYGSPDGVTILPAHQKNQLLLKAMGNIPFEKRGAKFVCSVTGIITPYKMYAGQE